jgi:soluble lytic murein transglycosylase-like protein
MKPRSILRYGLTLTLTLTPLAVIAALCPQARAAEHITLRNGFEFDCLRREPAGDRVRLYLIPTARANSSAQAAPQDASYIEVSAASVLRVDVVPDPPAAPAPPPPLPTPWLSSRSVAQGSAFTALAAPLTAAEMRQMLDRAGTLHNIDTDLLASIVHAESNGNARAVSRAGARGLMQLMPSTASDLGVRNSFAPDENISGGTAYLDQLLTRYHDDLRLAVAAYNAGPAAVDRYHGIPPYAETRAYVARVVREFNRRKLAALSTQPAAHASLRAAD